MPFSQVLVKADEKASSNVRIHESTEVTPSTTVVHNITSNILYAHWGNVPPLASAGQSVIRNYGGLDVLAVHFPEEPQGLCEIRALLASAGQG